MQSRRARPMLTGIETLEGRRLTASVAAGAMARPAAAEVRTMDRGSGGYLQVSMEDVLISSYSVGTSS